MKKKLIFLVTVFFMYNISSYALTFSYGNGKKVEASEKLIQLKQDRIVASYGDQFDREELKLMVFNQTIENLLLIDMAGVKVTKKEVEDYYTSEWKNYNPDDEKEFIDYLINTSYGKNKEEILVLFEYDLARNRATEILEQKNGNTEKLIVQNKSTIMFPQESIYKNYYDKKIVVTGEELKEYFNNFYNLSFYSGDSTEKLKQGYEKALESSKMINEAFKYFTIEIYQSQLTNLKLDILNSAYDYYDNVLYGNW